MANESSSTHRLVTSAGVHRFTIDGHSVAARSSAPILSKPFWVGGYEWTIRYYPNGSATSLGEHTSVFPVLSNAGDGDEGDISTVFTFSCLQDPACPTAEEKNKVTHTIKFNSKQYSGYGLGTAKFMKISDLAASGCLKNDCLVINCTVEVITEELIYDDQGNTGVVVPPSDLTKQLGHLLESGDAADITIGIIGGLEQFRAHRSVLTARSPVFSAMLCGSMSESKKNNICIEDMEASIFKVLLHYMYHDDLPVFMKDVCTEEAVNMAQHVLVAADRYGMERLMLICESMLSKTMDVYTVCSTLGFADQHNCEQLKNCCLAYMLKDRERLNVIVKTEGFKQLSQKCAFSVACEVFVKSLEITPQSNTIRCYYSKYAPIFVVIISFCIMIVMAFYIT
ncbi:unnamed protein product [Alopecurus aequalis]